MTGVIRDRKLDVAKGILILLVVVGHFLETSGGAKPGDLFSGWTTSPQSHILSAIYAFHMPAFVFLAGVNASTRQLASRVVQVLTLFVVLEVVYNLIGSAVGFPMSWHGPFYALWFLLTLGYWLVTMVAVERWPWLTLAVAVAAAILSGVLPVAGGVLAWSRGLYFWPFFVAGAVIGRPLLARLRRPGLALPAAMVGLAGAVSVGLSSVDAAWWRGNENFSEIGVSTAHGIAMRVFALVVSAVLCLCFLAAIPATAGLVETLGRRSLSVYALHIAAIVGMEEFFEHAHDALGNGLSIAVAVVAAIAVAALLGGVAAFDRVVRAVSRLISDRAGAHLPGRVARPDLAGADGVRQH